MTTKTITGNEAHGFDIDRRETLALAGSAIATAVVASTAAPISALADSTQLNQGADTTPEAFVYTELQISVPFEKAGWQKLISPLRAQPGLLNKTWLAGKSNGSIGGLYAFKTIDNAQSFVTGFFPNVARELGVAQTTRIFDARATEAASRDLNSAHYDGKLDRKPGAFVYTEVQVSVPFESAPWRDRNPILRQQAGLLGKTWLSGLHTQTLGGFDVFDTLEHAEAFAIDTFPKTARKLNAAFYTRVFDARPVEAASRQLNSPFFT